MRNSRKLKFGILGMCAAAFAFSPRVFAEGDAPEKAVQPKANSNFTEMMAPMRDNVRLAGNVFLPKTGTGPFPTVITRTPYGKDTAVFMQLAGQHTARGFAFVAQDCRGKFKSEGKYRAFEDDLNDGYDTVEWVAQQPFCNGKVGIMGASAMGITSNLAAAADPPHLTAAFVIVAPSSMFYESSFQGGVFKEADVGKWLKQQNAIEQLMDIVKRPVMDDRWRQSDLPAHVGKIRIPMYNVGGWYDMFNQGNVNNFVYLQYQGREGAKGNQKLYMGPFGHGNLSGDLTYPKDSGIIGVIGEGLRWFDYWLKGVDNGIMTEPNVKYYQMASARKGQASDINGYKAIEDWPPKTNETRYYLQEGFALSTEKPTEASSFTFYDFNPSNPVPTVGGANLTLDRGPKDQREIGERQDYLRYQTPPLDKNVTVAGQVFVELWVSTNAPDTDFHAKLVDVYPDGYEAILLDAPMRCRYRYGREPKDVKMMTPGKVEKLRLDLWSTANTFEIGHRIALHVTSSNSPRFEVNPNTGEAPGESKLPPRTAKNNVHHEAEHASAVILPILAE